MSIISTWREEALLPFHLSQIGWTGRIPYRQPRKHLGARHSQKFFQILGTLKLLKF